MPKFSDFIRFPGTAGPPTREGIKALGFLLTDDIPTILGKFLRVDLAQTFSAGEKTQGRANLGVVIGTDVQAYDAGLQSIAGLTTVADRMLYTTGADVYAVATLTPFARTILDDAAAVNVRATIGTVIGTDVQAFDAGLQSIAGLTTAADKMIYTTALDTYAVADLSPFARTILDDTSASAVRTTIGLGNVDNTSDANKPVSTAQSAAIAAAAGVGAVRAWVNFNGTGAATIRASANVSSVTYNGTGNYTVNMTSAIVDANYVISGSVGGTAGIASAFRTADDATPRTVSLFRVSVFDNAGTARDVAQVNLVATR